MSEAIFIPVGGVGATQGIASIPLPDKRNVAISLKVGSISTTTPVAVVAGPAVYFPTTDLIAAPAHGLATGQKITLAGTGLPTGLSATAYYAIVISPNTFALAASQADALAGTKVDFSSSGTLSANHTFTPEALAGASVALEFRNVNDDNMWVTVSSSSQNITAAGVFGWDISSNFTELRFKFTMSAGAVLDCKAFASFKNERGSL